MDFSRFKTPDWLMIGGALAMLILGMALDWAELGGVSGNGPFDYFFTGGIAWLLTVAVGIVALLLAVGTIKSDSAPWPTILVGAAGLATLLMLLRLILGGGEEGGGGFKVELDRGVGMYVAFIAAAVTLVGAVMNFTSKGGNLRDLTDMGKVRGSFGGGSTGTGQAPPPPPPPASPPPPPAP